MLKKIVILIIGIISLSTLTFAKDEYIKGKIISLEEVRNAENGYESDIIKEVQVYKVRILQGREKGRDVLVEHTLFKDDASNINVSKSSRVVVMKDGTSRTELYYIVDIDKTGWLVGMFSIFLILTLLIAKKRGLKAIIALGITCFAIIRILIPLIISGYSPILISTGIAVFSCFLTIALMTDLKPKGISAIIGSIIGVLTAGGLSLIYTNAMGLTGFSSNDIITMAHMLEGINLKELISAGVILGSMGAVMDVGMSIASSLNEIKERDSNITKGELFISGINIGSDIIGTMVNTLILAYAGSSLITMLLIIMQGGDYPLVRILNFEFISVEIMRALCGSIGILVAVPATAYISSIFYTRKK